MMILRPMLFPPEDPLSYERYFEELPFPLLGSPKYDGIRSVVEEGVALSRTLKPLPSVQVQEDFALVEFTDGELIEGNMRDFDVYNRTQSYVMSFLNPGNLSYHVFDFRHPDWIGKEFYRRLEKAHEMIRGHPNYFPVEHREIDNIDELLDYEQDMLDEGWEGLMLRNPVGYYKSGKCTWKQQLGFKLKRFKDDEGLILEIEEGTVNENEQERDERGYAKRSTKKDGLVLAGTTGTIIVEHQGRPMRVGPGALTHQQREELFKQRHEHEGKSYLKFRHTPHGVKNQLRQARAIGLRSLIDM
jgi:DNA ligase-1